MERNPIIRILRHFFGSAAAASAGSGDARIASTKDVDESKPFCAVVGGREIAVFRTKAGYGAIDNVCPHLGGPLCKGKVENGVVQCPWHGSKFDVATGAVVKGPAKAGVTSYAVEQRGDDLYLKSMPAAAKAPKTATFAYGTAFDKEKPFDHKLFLDELLAGLKFPFKLHGVLPFVVIAQGADEIDLHLGQVHITEMDLKKMSALMDSLNAKWGTAITFCLYHASQFPGDMLLNIRGPKAPSTTQNDIRF